MPRARGITRTFVTSGRRASAYVVYLLVRTRTYSPYEYASIAGWRLLEV